MTKKTALGKGIASLLPSGGNMATELKKMAIKSDSEGNDNIMLVDIDSIQSNPFQPRKKFLESDLKELSDSIRENGVIQPLVVTKTEHGLELIAGERRLKASKMANLKKVPVVLKRATDRDKLVFAIIENVQRSDLNCVEEAYAYFQLMDEFKLTQEEVARKIGKERSTIANFLRILRLPRKIISFLQEGSLSFGHAKLLVGLKNPELEEMLGSECVEKKLTVRDLEARIAEILHKSKNDRNDNLNTKLKSDNSFEQVKQNLERKLGMKIKIQSKDGNEGQFQLAFLNIAEFNKVYDLLMRS